MSDLHEYSGRRFVDKLGFAFHGVRTCWKEQSHFRIHCWISIAAILFFAFTGATAIWMAVLFFLCGAVLAAECLNSALEKVCDRFGSEPNLLIQQAKDMAAAAVLILAFAAIAFAGAYLVEFSSSNPVKSSELHDQ